MTSPPERTGDYAQDDAPPSVTVRSHAPVLPAEPGDVRSTVSIGPSGELVTLWSTETARATATQRTVAVVTRVVVQQPRPREVRLTAVPIALPHVQPLSDGRTLVVDGLARWRPEGADRNAVIFDADGRITTTATLGDGVAHAYATHTGHVWVGYTDEGIGGNNGWGGNGAPQPIGAPGIVRFTPELELDWTFPPIVGDDVLECDALNVTDEEVWACYYGDFPVVRIRADHPGVWRNDDVEGADALMIAEPVVVIAGGYAEEHDRLLVGHLDDDVWRATHEFRLTLPDDRPLPMSTRIFGRGPDLHLVTADRWYRLDLADIPGAS